MFTTLEKHASNILMSIGVLLVLLIILFGVLHFASIHAPSPIGSFVDKATSLATPGGWSTNS